MPAATSYWKPQTQLYILNNLSSLTVRICHLPSSAFKNSDTAAAAFYDKILLYVHKRRRKPELLIKGPVQEVRFLLLGLTKITKELLKNGKPNPNWTYLCSRGWLATSLQAGPEAPPFLKSRVCCICLPWNQKGKLHISKKCQKDPQNYVSACFFLFFPWKNCAVILTQTDRCRWRSFWGGTENTLCR